ncbi:MAG: TetR/AcrR family transcriptional regulator [Sciscionella sp.]
MTAASTPKGERRRQALIGAAVELLIEGGFDAVRHRAVAERAGLPLASTTYYFDSLDELVLAAVEQHGQAELARGRERLAELLTRKRGVDATAELVIEQLLGPVAADAEADYEAVLLRYERLVATGRRPFLRPLSRALGAELHELLREVLGRSGIELDSARVARVIALVDGAVVNALIEIDPHPRRAAQAALLGELSG